MKIIIMNKKVMPKTYEVRYYFSGYITPEEIQDTMFSSYGMTYEKFGKNVMHELNEAYEFMNLEE